MKKHTKETAIKNDWPTYKMQAYRVERTVPADKTLILEGLPFSTGDKIEVLIVRQAPRGGKSEYPLRGTPVEYKHPFESVAENEWDAHQ
jgi:hypothetical protein